MKNEKIKIEPALTSADKRPKSTTEKELTYHLVTPPEYIVQRDRLPPGLLAFLTRYVAEDYEKKQTSLYLSEDGRCGFGLNPDGELISVFSLEKGRGKALVKAAVAHGAKYLSCLGQKLQILYGDAGFQVMREYPWDDAYAPESWDYSRFDTPNCYEMEMSRK